MLGESTPVHEGMRLLGTGVVPILAPLPVRLLVTQLEAFANL